MEPRPFPESNRVLSGDGITAPGVPSVGSLNVWTNEYMCVSCWRPTWRERLSVLFFGRVWLSVLWGHTQPPVSVTAVRRFFRPAEGGRE